MHGSRPPRQRTPGDANQEPKKPKTLPFVMVSSEIALDAGLSDGAFRLYVILATFADIKARDGIAGRRAAGKRLGKSPRTITRLLAELEEKGVIARKERRQTMPSGKERRTTDDWVLLDRNATSGAKKDRAGAYGFEEIVEINAARDRDGRDPLDERVADAWAHADQDP